MEMGKKIHKLFEMVDLKYPDYNSLDDFEKTKIKQFLSNDIFKNIKDSKIYKEFEFEYKKDNILYKGIIDLMIEYDDYIDIIDYKLSNVEDENYYNQLEGYKKYISTKTDKKINIYLYSILKGNLKKLM